MAIAFSMLVLRALFTLDLTARPWLFSLGWAREASMDMSIEAAAALLHFEHAGIGPLALLFEPPVNWFTYDRQFSTELWFFRTEASLHVLVIALHCCGQIGYVAMLALILWSFSYLYNAAGSFAATNLYWHDVFNAFPTCLATYCTGALWHQCSKSRSWRGAASVVLLAVG